jgi:hypothetical protein
VPLGAANAAGRSPVTFPVSEGRREASIPIGIAQLQMLDLHLSWRVESDIFRVVAGASSRTSDAGRRRWFGDLVTTNTQGRGLLP